MRKWEQKTYDDLVRSIKNDAYALVECVDTRTNRRVKVLCGVFLEDGEEVAFPLAVLITTQEELKALKYVRGLDETVDQSNR